MTRKNGSRGNSLDAEKREQIIFHRSYQPENYKQGGICQFEGITLKAIRELLEPGFIKSDDYMNASPTVQEFTDFVEAQDPDNWSFHSYAVSPKRDDSRVTIEGLRSNKPLSKDDLIDFLQYFRYADILDAERDEPAYCWYD